jgi:hypothetical protein
VIGSHLIWDIALIDDGDDDTIDFFFSELQSADDGYNNDMEASSENEFKQIVDIKKRSIGMLLEKNRIIDSLLSTKHEMLSVFKNELLITQLECNILKQSNETLQLVVDKLDFIGNVILYAIKST